LYVTKFEMTEDTQKVELRCLPAD